MTGGSAKTAVTLKMGAPRLAVDFNFAARLKTPPKGGPPDVGGNPIFSDGGFDRHPKGGLTKIFFVV